MEGFTERTSIRDMNSLVYKQSFADMPSFGNASMFVDRPSFANKPGVAVFLSLNVV